LLKKLSVRAGNRLQVLRHGNRLQGTGYREQVTGNRLQGTGYREQVTGNRLQGTGYREQEINSFSYLDILNFQNPTKKNAPILRYHQPKPCNFL
jgi:hypothetical protein